MCAQAKQAEVPASLSKGSSLNVDASFVGKNNYWSTIASFLLRQSESRVATTYGF